MNRDQKGFTLLELIVTVGIVALLAAIAIPKYGELLEKTNLGATLGNLSSIRSSVSIYYSSYMELPRSISPEREPQFENNIGRQVPFVKATYPYYASPKGNEVEDGPSAPTESKTGWYYNYYSGYVYINSVEKDISGTIYSIY